MLESLGEQGKIFNTSALQPVVTSRDVANGSRLCVVVTVCLQDPFPKPCYLFSLVAGDMALREDTYTTHSGRTINLKTYVPAAFINQVSNRPILLLLLTAAICSITACHAKQVLLTANATTHYCTFTTVCHARQLHLVCCDEGTAAVGRQGTVASCLVWCRLCQQCVTHPVQ